MDVDIFLSYARADDAGDGGISAFRQALQAEISRRLGREVAVFQDTGIPPGERWRAAVERGLSASVVMVCIVTPLFLASSECRSEFDAFTRDEDRQRRANIVVPLHYLDAELIASGDARIVRQDDDATIRAQKAFATRLVDRQLRDIRPIRRVPPPELLSREATRELVHTIAADIALRLQRAEKRRGDVLDVDQRRGPFRTISAALEAARAGATIRVGAGDYEESLIIDKPVRLVGQRPGRRPTIVAVGAPTMTVTASFCVVEGLEVRAQRDLPTHAIVVAGGRLELERCDVGGSAYACLFVSTGAELRMQACRVHDSQQSGVLVHGQASISRCRIHRNEHLGIHVERHGTADISHSVIRRCRVGIQFAEGARGTARGNRLSRNHYAGMHISSGADPVVVDNRIQFNDASGNRDVCGGILVYRFGNADTPGRGRILHNIIRLNSGAGIEIKDGAAPIVYKNIIERNVVGLWAHLGAQGRVVRNRFVANRSGNLRLEDANPTLTQNALIASDASTVARG